MGRKGVSELPLYYANELYDQDNKGMPLTSTAEQQRRVSPGPSSGRVIPMNWEMGCPRTTPEPPNIISRRSRRLSRKK